MRRQKTKNIDWAGIIADDARAETPPTAEVYAGEWLARRRDRGLRTVADDAARIARYVTPPLGALRLDEISPRIVSRWLARVSDLGLSARTVRRIYQVLAGLMRSAAIDGWIETVPTMHSSQLPPDVDADPGRLARAPLSAAETVGLISSQLIPINRRIVWALGALGGLRIGEIGGLNWLDYDSTRRPLGSISVVRQYCSRSRTLRDTKTRAPRIVPVHPRLARVLAEWRATYARIGGRLPVGADPIVLTQARSRWSAYSAKRALVRDCGRLGIARHTPHDLRTTFATLARNAPRGERREIISIITHAKPRDVLESYTVTGWAALCRAVAAIELPAAGVVVSGVV